MSQASKIVWLWLALALLCGCERKVMSEHDFTEAFVEELKAANPDLQVEIAGNLELRAEGNRETNSIYLGNAYTAYRSAPGERSQIMAAWVQSVLEMKDGMGALSVAHIVPILKDVGFVKDIKVGIQQRGRGTDRIEFVTDPLNSDLSIVYAHDSERNIRYLQARELDSLGVHRDQLQATALENLQRIIPQPRIHEVIEGMYLVTVDGTYESSLLLLPAWWTTNRFNVKGDIVVAIPRREVLMVTGSRETEGLPRMRALAQRYYTEGPYELTDRLFAFRNGRFVRFE